MEEKEFRRTDGSCVISEEVISSIASAAAVEVPGVAGMAQRPADIRGIIGSAAARAVREKSIEMIRQAQLLPLTGYVHGGCSPLGMKKQFTTVLDESARGRETMTVSAGRIGAQVELAPDDLCRLSRGSFAPVGK